MSDAKQLDARMLQMQDALRACRMRTGSSGARNGSPITRTIADLKVAYSKFETSGGESNRYTIESQTARYRELMKAADGLFDPPALKRVADIYERDLNEAYKIEPATVASSPRLSTASRPAPPTRSRRCPSPHRLRLASP